jgi:hypothetical protein
MKLMNSGLITARRLLYNCTHGLAPCVNRRSDNPASRNNGCRRSSAKAMAIRARRFVLTNAGGV